MHARLDSILRSGWLIEGCNTRAYEAKLAGLCQRLNCVATNSGTAAFEVALRAAGITCGEIIFPTNGFTGTALLTRRTNTTPVFCDIDIHAGLSPTWDQIQQVLTENTVAVSLTQIGGFLAAESERIESECRRRNIVLIEDCAHSIGASLNGRAGGSFGDVAIASTKHNAAFSTGSGGGVLTNDGTLANRARQVMLYGRDQAFGGDAFLFLEDGYSWRITELQAALGVCIFAEVDQIAGRRREIAAIYDDLLTWYALDRFEVRRIAAPIGCEPIWFRYMILLPTSIDRGNVKKGMANREMPLAGEVFTPLIHQQPVWGDLYNHLCFPQAELFSTQHINLPVWVDMDVSEQESIVAALAEVVQSEARS